jgi:hypothetical protein
VSGTSPDNPIGLAWVTGKLLQSITFPIFSFHIPFFRNNA